jgi:hypothetical protein
MHTREALIVDPQLSTIHDLVKRGKKQKPELSSRIEKALIILAFREILPNGPGAWLIQSDDPSKYYEVDAEESDSLAGSCTCPDFPKAPRGWCKHRLALLLARKAAIVEEAKETLRRYREQQRREAADRATIAYAEAHRKAV